MKIRVMESGDLSEISRIDNICFERDEARSLENVNALRLSDPSGCFVIESKKNNGQIIGFLYSKALGEEGYLGPLAILPEFRENGYAKSLIEHGIDYLKQKCRVIGLEVLPESGENLGLYHQCGFSSTFPSIRYYNSEKFLNISENYELLKLSSQTPSKVEEVLEYVDYWTQSELEGVSYLKDIKTALKLKGETIVALKDNLPIGFIAFCEDLMPHPWGAVQPGREDHQNDNRIMEDLLAYYSQLNLSPNSLIEINGRYQNMNNLMIKNGFQIARSINRMLLKGFEGHHLETNSNLIMRAWIG